MIHMSRSKAEEGISSCHGFALAPRPLTTMSPFACESSVDTNKTACKTRGGVGSRQDYSPQERREDPAFISVRLRLRLRAPLVRHALALPPPAAALLSGHATWALPGDEIASESIGGVCVGLPITILCCACSEVQWKRSSAGAHVGRVRLFHGSTRLRCQVRKGGTRFYSRCNF
jgi:hypothetical protein